MPITPGHHQAGVGLWEATGYHSGDGETPSECDGARTESGSPQACEEAEAVRFSVSWASGAAGMPQKS